MLIHFWLNIVCNVDSSPEALFSGTRVLPFCMQLTLSRYILGVFMIIFFKCQLAVHGGIGEDGTLQALLEDGGVSYTG